METTKGQKMTKSELEAKVASMTYALAEVSNVLAKIEEKVKNVNYDPEAATEVRPPYTLGAVGALASSAHSIISWELKTL